MEVPLEIAFHNVDSSDWVETQIRERVAKLEKIYGRLTAARVRVERRAKPSTRTTIPPVVRLELGIPGGKDVVVSHEPEHLQRKFQAPDLRNAINEAFRIAEDQLVELKNQRHRRTREGHHDAGNQHLGQVTELTPGQDFGFILTAEGGQLYFHRNSVLSGDFDALKPGREVYYVESSGDTGPTAIKVRIR